MATDHQRFGKLMGAGYVNELIARLTDSVPEDSTTVNDTLDRDPSMFPRGGHRIFAVRHPLVAS